MVSVVEEAVFAPIVDVEDVDKVIVTVMLCKVEDVAADEVRAWLATLAKDAMTGLEGHHPDVKLATATIRKSAHIFSSLLYEAPHHTPPRRKEHKNHAPA